MSDILIPILGKTPLEWALEQDIEPGLILEFGVYQGKTISMIANKLPSYTVYGFDSFEGLPESWDRNDGGAYYKKGHFTTHKQLPDVPKNVILVAGLFDQTVPEFVKQHPSEKITFMHIDCDLYSSTRTVLFTLHPLIHNNTILVFDELINYPGYEKHELKALLEYIEWSNYKIEWLGTRSFFNPNPTHDLGKTNQSVACRIKTK